MAVDVRDEVDRRAEGRALLAQPRLVERDSAAAVPRVADDANPELAAGEPGGEVSGLADEVRDIVPAAEPLLRLRSLVLGDEDDAVGVPQQTPQLTPAVAARKPVVDVQAYSRSVAAQWFPLRKAGGRLTTLTVRAAPCRHGG
jgi:hypothetical protein